MRITAAIAVAVSFIASAMAGEPTPSETVVRSIRLNAPVSHEGAAAIAGVYLERHIPECGGLQPPEDHGTKWKVRPCCGYAGQPHISQIEVDKRTGAVSWKGGPSFSSPEKLLKNEP
jgi:hypothetical protein